MILTEREDQYIRARVAHSITAQLCWKLRAALDRDGLTPKREQELNDIFAQEMRTRPHK